MLASEMPGKCPRSQPLIPASLSCQRRRQAFLAGGPAMQPCRQEPAQHISSRITAHYESSRITAHYERKLYPVDGEPRGDPRITDELLAFLDQL